MRHNLCVVTVDETQPRAEAFAVKGSRSVAVGRNEDFRPLASADSTLINAEGITATPGFFDAHSHPSGAGVDELLNVNVNLRSVSAIQAVLCGRVEATPPGKWVAGRKYDDTKLGEGRPINRRHLDKIAPNHPVEVRHGGGHTAVYNNRAFRLAGVPLRLLTRAEGDSIARTASLQGSLPSTREPRYAC